MQDDNHGSLAPSASPAAPPAPAPAFRWQREGWGLALRCGPLDSVAQHLFTSRQLELPAQASAEARAAAWTKVGSSVGVVPDRVMRVRQVHGNVVRVVRREAHVADAARERPDGDALVSDAPGVALAVLVADCVPILLADPVGGAAAAVHAGWRGTCARVAEAAVESMAREFRTEPADLVAALGPSIGPDDYEVGEALREQFTKAGHDPAAIARWFRRREDTGRWFLDLWQANRDQLETAGVRATAIFVSGLSTPRHPEWLESYRRDGDRAGRMAAIVVVPASTCRRSSPSPGSTAGRRPCSARGARVRIARRQSASPAAALA